jgi:hypothetical protein
MKKSYWVHVRWYKGAMPGMQPQYGIIFTLTPGTGPGGGAPQAFFNSLDHLVHGLEVLGCGREIANTKRSLDEHGGYLIQDVLLDDDELRAVGVELPQPVGN